MSTYRPRDDKGVAQASDNAQRVYITEVLIR